MLTSADHAFFDENGYVVIATGLPQANLDAMLDAIFTFLGMDANNPQDWYRPPHRPVGMVEMYHHPAMWANRQHPALHAIFSEILGTERLLVSEDRAGFKPPVHPDFPAYDHSGFVHWDLDTSKLPVPFGVQGVLCLTDTSADMGGFRCIPGFHKDLPAWIATQPADRNNWHPDLNALPPGKSVTPIPAKAGDIIVWNTLLAHGIGRNLDVRPRMAQYITMHRADEATDAELAARVDRFQRRLPPPYERAFPGDSRKWEETHALPVALTPLGRRLLGIDRWP
jgi:ectoine hydroxylase-related dioxygenase (phytanoyl-CoA dioxygenase family)